MKQLRLFMNLNNMWWGRNNIFQSSVVTKWLMIVEESSIEYSAYKNKLSRGTATYPSIKDTHLAINLRIREKLVASILLFWLRTKKEQTKHIFIRRVCNLILFSKFKSNKHFFQIQRIYFIIYKSFFKINMQSIQIVM